MINHAVPMVNVISVSVFVKQAGRGAHAQMLCLVLQLAKIALVVLTDVGVHVGSVIRCSGVRW